MANDTVIIPLGSPDYIPGNNTSGGTRTVRPPSESNVSERRLTVAAEGTVIPHIYGRAQVQAKVFAVGSDSRYWYIGAEWCLGGTYGVAAVEKVFNGDKEIPVSDRQDYLGRQSQDTFYGRVGGEEELGVASAQRNWLYESIPNYSDKMVAELLDERVGVCYSIIRILLSEEVNQLTGQINGFLVKDYSSANVPDTSLPVAMPLQMENGWSKYAGLEARYFKMDDGSVFVQGLVKDGADGSAVISILPKNIAPAYHHVASVFTNNETARCDVRLDGAIVSPWGSAHGGFDTVWASITFDYCADDSGWIPMELENGWTNYAPGAKYPPLSYKVMGDGRVYIRGLVNPGISNTVVANLPSELAPPAGLIFSCRTYGDSDCRVDIVGTEIIARNPAGWVGIYVAYYPDNEGWEDLPLLGGWQNYGGVWQSAQYKKMPSGIVAVRGLVRNAAYEQNIAQLPTGCRPSATLITCKTDGTNSGRRIDFREVDGILRSEYPTLDTSYLSLNQMFVASDEMWGLVPSTNPSNALADHIESKSYGLGAEIGSVTTTSECADCNNEWLDIYGNVIASPSPSDLVQRRHEIGYIMSSTYDSTKYVDILRDYANCFVQYFGDKVYMISDRSLTVSRDPAELTMPMFMAVFDDTNIIHGTLKVKKTGDRNRPTVVRVTYSERTATQNTEEDGAVLWTEDSTVKYFNDNIEDVGRWKESKLPYVGIPSRSQATRKAVEYMNHLWLEDLEIEFDTFGEAMTLYNGSPFLLKHTIGIGTDLSNIDGYKPFRCVKCVLVGPNRYRVYGREHQEDAYSNDIDITPSIPDTNLPNITLPAAISGIDTLELSSRRGNNFYTYFYATITTEPGIPDEIQSFEWVSYLQGVKPPPGSLFSDGFEGLVEHGRGVCGPEKRFITPALNKDATYIIKVLSKNSAYNTVAEDWFSVTVKALGRDDPPGIPINFQGYEAGGNIRLLWSWDSSLDEFQIPLYEIRYLYDKNAMPASNDWDSAELFAKVNANFVSKAGQIAGYYKFFIKAIDVFGTYSDTAAITEVKSDSDEKYFIDNDWDYELTWVSNSYLYKPRRSEKAAYGHTCCDLAFGSLFTGTMSSYDSAPIYRYYPVGYSFPLSRIGLGVDDGDMSTANPVVFPTPLHGEFSSLVEEFNNAGPIDTTGNTIAGTGEFVHQIANPDTGTEYVEGIRNKFSTYASSILGYAQGNSFLLRVDNAKLIGYFATRTEEGEIVTENGTSGNEIVPYTISLAGHYYKAYEITLTIVGNPSETESIGADAVAEDIVVSPLSSVQNRFDVYVTNKFTGESVARRVRWVFKGV